MKIQLLPLLVIILLLIGSISAVGIKIDKEVNNDCRCKNELDIHPSKAGSLYTPMTPLDSLPENYDLREEINMPTVENQGSRGTCWAMAPIAAFEVLIKKNIDRTVDLSEQWLISCTDAGTADEGSYSEALTYLGRTGYSVDSYGDAGAVLESDFPYETGDSLPWPAPPNVPDCDGPYNHKYILDDWNYVSDPISNPYPSVETIQQAIYDHGPIVTGVYAGEWWGTIVPWTLSWYWKYYDGTYVFDHDSNDQPNHAFVIVGWHGKPNDSNGYWIVRNSWVYTPLGGRWGQDEDGDTDGSRGGYMLIKYGRCNIGYLPCYLEYSGDSLNAELIVRKGGDILNDGDIISPTDQITFVGKATGGVSRFIYELDPDGDGYQFNNSDKTYDDEYYIKTNYQYGTDTHGEVTITLRVRDYQYYNADKNDYDDSDTDTLSLIVNSPPNMPSCSYDKGTYYFETTDPDGDKIYYVFKWADGTTTRYPSSSGYVSSGVQQTLKHSAMKGRIKAVDVHGAESGWNYEDDTNEESSQSIRNYFENNFEKLPILRLIIENLIKSNLWRLIK